MIRHIVALDNKRGIAKNSAMPPWKLKQDETFFREQTLLYSGFVLMGKKTYVEALHSRPLPNRTNYVATHDTTPLAGAELVNDLTAFLQAWPKDKNLWVIGGAEIFKQTMDIADELLITEIKGDFECDRFYPEYLDNFELVSRSEPVLEHGITYTFCTYRPKRSR